jgi:hypothetical protein
MSVVSLRIDNKDGKNNNIDCGENNMGHVNTQVTLKNLDDTKQAKKGNLPEHKIRQVTWENRFVAMSALVVEDASEFLLGVLPLEGMDLMVDTVNQRLVGVHGDHPVYLAKTLAVFP